MGKPGFVLFGPDHLGALLAVAAATAAALLYVRGRPERSGARRLALALATALPALWAAENVVAWAEGWLTWQIGLPLHLCDISLILATAGLLTRRVAVVEPLYFFVLAGTIPALITPELDEGLPEFRFLIYFLPHGLTVLSMVVLVFGFRLVPRPGAWWRVFGLLNLIALAVTAVNLLLDTNFLYLRAKPHGPTPIDWFGPWPFYILTLEAAFLLTFFLLDLPLRPLRRRRSDDPRARRSASEAHAR